MKKRVNKKAFIAFVLLLFFFSQPAFAVTKTSVANGNWSAAATWSPSGVPGASDNVIINTNVVLDVDIEVVGPFTLTINAGKSLIGNSTSRRLGYDLTSGSPIVFTNNGTFTIGILNRTASGSTNNTDWIFNNYGTFTIQNTGACNGTSSPFAFGYGIFTNFAGGVVNSSGCFYLGGGSSLGVLHNYGSMTLDEYNVHSSATWRNHPGGIITITGLLTAGGLNQDNDGCINALGGIRVFEKGGNNNLGTFTMHDNAKLFVAAGTSFNVNSNTILTGVDDDGNNANNGCISSSVQITNSGTITGEFYLNDPDGLVSGTVGSQVVLGTGNCGGVCAVSCTTPTAITFTQVAPTCTGATANNNGTISLATATNGTHFGISTLNAASYDGPTTVAGATALGALPMVIKSSVPNTGGTYRVRIFNGADACFTDMTVTVNAVTCVCTPPPASITGTNTICNGSSTTLTASGGGTYLWSTGEVTAAITVSPSSTTTYTVTVTLSGCTATANRTVTVTQPPSAISFTQVPATCTGATANNNGTISLASATNATHFGISTLNAASYDGPTTIATATALGALPMVIKSSVPNTGGTYRVRIFNGSDGCYTDQTVTVNAVSCVCTPPLASITGTNTICNGSSTTLTASGGDTYLWNTGAITAAITVSPAATTTYTVTVTASGCTATANRTVTVTQPPSAITFSQVPATCTGNTPNNNGTISLTAVTDGTHIGFSSLNSATYDGPSTIATATALGALPMVVKSSIPNAGGTYRVRIFNGADGCFTDQTVTVAPVTCGACPSTAYTLCAGDSYTLTAQSGMTGYQWFTVVGAVETPIAGANSAVYIVTATGIYKYTATDATGCPGQLCCPFTFITGACCVAPSGLSFSQTAPTCTGTTPNNNGTISLTAATNRTHFGISSLNAVSYDGPTTIATATAIGALPMLIKSAIPNTGGTYKVRIFNGADGCYTEQTITIPPVNCGTPCTVPASLSFTQVAPTCTVTTPNNNGTISLSTATNGTHYGISTLNAGSYNGPTTIATATALGALPMVIKSSVPNTGGTYIVRVFNTADGCYTDQTVTVNPVSCTCTTPTASITGTNIICNGTSTTLTANGGDTYLWDTGATTQAITVTPTSNTTYTVTVTLLGCTATANQLVTVTQPPSAISFTQVPPNCTNGVANNNGSISLAAATNGTHFGISTLNAASYNGPTTIATATPLGALPMVIKTSVPNAGGTYRVRVFNGADGCYTDQTITVAEVRCFGAINSVALIICSGLNMNLVSAPIGGTAPYTYLWSGPSGFTSNIQNPTVPTVTVANSGTYVVTVTEGTGMTATATTSVTILPPGHPDCISPCINPTNITLTAQKATCNGLVPLNNGTITITAATNVTHFGVSTLNAASYDGPTTIATATLLSGIPMVLKSAIPSAGGTYIIRIFNGQDACYTERIVTVSATSCFGAVVGSTISVCSGADLALVSSPNGGTAPYAYHWSGPAGFTSNLQNPTVLAVTSANAGTYNLTVTENTGLTATSSTTVNVLPLGSAGCASAGPVAVNDALTIPEGGTGIGTVALNDSDPNNTLAELIFTFGNPTSGTISTQPDGSYMFTPSSPDFNGMVIVPYTVCDPTSLCDDAVLVITVTPVNDPPVAVNDNATVIKGSSVIIPVLNNDSNGPDGALVPSTVTVTVAPLHGTTFVNPTTGQVTYVPDSNYEGLDVFTYQVCDDGMPAPGACATALVNITVVPDKDNDGIPDNTDIDDDNDGILDANENPAGYADGGGDLDNDGAPNYKDAQNPNCGSLNSMAVCSNYDKDGDGVPDQFDLDSDNDGLTDVVEAGASDPDNNGIIGTGLIPTDADQDGLADAVDFSPTSGSTGSVGTPNIDTDGDGKPNAEDLDADNDGLNDILESGGLDPDNNGIAGTGGTPTDTDLDGLVDVADQSPNAFGDANNTTPNQDIDGDGKSDSRDIDTDNDGITDVVESGGNDPDNNGIAGTGAVPTDTDGDGIPDVADESTIFGDTGNSTTYNDMDNDGIPNAEDIDSDNDGLTDVMENGISDPDNNGLAGTGLLSADTDGDGLADVADQSGTYGDAANSNTPPNTDGTGAANYLDIDADDDGIVDNIEWQTTVGYVAPSGMDSDGDGLDNAYDQSGSYGDTFNSNSPTNTDGTDNPDYTDTNSDNDLLLDIVEGWDSNGDLVANTTPTGVDIDNDGLDDAFDTNDVAVNPSNGTVPNDYPNFFPSATTERDWREAGIEICGNGVDDDGDGSIDETCPDFTPTIEMDNVTFLTGNVSRDFVINISEIRNAPSQGAIVLKIPKISAFTYTFSPTATSANVYGGSPVNNALWDMTQNALFITLTLKPGVVLPGYNIYSVGMNVTRKANIPTQTNQPITVTIVDKSGSDNDDFNNTYNVVIKAQ